MPQFSLFTEDLEHVLEHTRDAWEDLRGERIFITGGTGFFGMWLLESFLWANERLGSGRPGGRAYRAIRGRSAQRRPHLADAPALSFHQGDVRNFAFPDGTFSPTSSTPPPRPAPRLTTDNPVLMLDTIVAGTPPDAGFRRRIAGRRRFLLTSSGAVYGRQPPEMTHIGEDYPGAPDPWTPSSAYGEGKARGRTLCAVLYARHTDLKRRSPAASPLWTVSAAGRPFCRRQFHPRRAAGGPIRVNGDGTPVSFLPLRRRSGRLAVDDPFSRPVVPAL